jgi:DNA polymerase III alpha subunit
MLDGACRVDRMIKLAKNMKCLQWQIQITGIYSVLWIFIKLPVLQGLNPIIGIEAYIVNGDIEVKAARMKVAII